MWEIEWDAWNKNHISKEREREWVREKKEKE